MNWRPIDTCPIGTEALFMGRIWRHPYWGIKNGGGGMVYVDGIGGKPDAFQAYDAVAWMVLPPVESATPSSVEALGSVASEANHD